MTMDVHGIFKLKNPIQNYAWGSRTAIANLRGLAIPADQPEAELWMGAHPKAPSRVMLAGQTTSLAELIQSAPEAILGPDAAHRFAGRMPFLFKVLAAAEPLSLQAHPDKDQARSGFERENRLGIPIDAPHRNYRDDSHKPEIICALTPFWGLNGFRSPSAIAEDFSAYGPRTLSSLVARLETKDAARALKDFFIALLGIADTHKHAVIEEVTASARQKEDRSPAADWVLRLQGAYPGDIGILAPLFLNLVCLSPGQAMNLAAGQLHAYLEGVGIELMANSDNVLRGGLTPKHIDVAELTRVLQFSPCEPRILVAQPEDAHARIYATDTEAFSLARIDVSSAHEFVAASRRSIEILLVVEGSVSFRMEDAQSALTIDKGESVLVPACLPGYAIQGDGRIFRASVPL
ncbi:MAG: mannose-6-phosphate isomerase, class I [Desulfobacterales bacterium]|nr:mannose-6-phosphate isomerase, class I [Desulfobacterales bacterium]